VFWVKALPSRAHGAAIIPGFELEPGLRRSALVHRFAEAARWATARRLSGPAYYRFDNTGSLAHPERKIRSLAPPSRLFPNREDQG